MFKIRNIKYIIVLIVLFLIWAELGVGIFGTPLLETKIQSILNRFC